MKTTFLATLTATLLAICTIPTMAEDPAAATTLPAGKPAAAEGSVFDLTSEWRDQDDNKITLSDLGDKVRVIVMGYTSCQYACPRLIADLAAIESGLKEDDASGQIGYAFISIDPEKDTPAKLKELETQYKFTPGHWKLLTGDEDGVLELAVALGMKYRKTSALDFAHSNIITVLRRDGSIAHQQVGLGEDKSPTLAAIRAAAKGP
jgi:protein SCO1/2